MTVVSGDLETINGAKPGDLIANPTGNKAEPELAQGEPIKDIRWKDFWHVA